MAVSLLLLGLFLFSFLSKWNEIIFQRKGLPPGTMGWPFFGETNEFLKLGPNFMKRQTTRLPLIYVNSSFVLTRIFWFSCVTNLMSHIGYVSNWCKVYGSK